MNVALTRARSSLFILGHAPTLERSDDYWRQIIQDARSRSFINDVSGYSIVRDSIELIMVSQADATFFATPSGATRAPLPSRLTISTPVVSLPLPLDLAKPRDLVATVNRGLSSTFPSPPKPKRPPSIQQNDRTFEYTNDDAPDAQEPPVGQQWSVIGPTSQTGHDSMENGGKVRTHPPVKRPKKDKTSIFIPKKPNKVRPFPLAIYLHLTCLQRPVPDGDSSGPPNGRRRL